MREDVQQLVKIQDLDQKISTINNELERIPKEQDMARERLANDEAALAAAKSAYQQNEIAIKNVDLDRGTRKTTIEKLKNQQFETKKNDEYLKLGSEVERYEAMVDELETQELELMEKSDECRAAITQAEEALAKTQKIVDEEIAELQARAESRKAELAETKTAREQEATKVDEDLMADYERLFSKREGNAVAKVSPDRICDSCHVQVISSTFIAAKSGDSIAECDNCGSILYLG
ncbi:MAG: zinc ribbon domain-containing protein [Verrucomicrobiaceae bacterium]